MGRSRKLEYLVKNYSDTDTNNQNFIFLRLLFLLVKLVSIFVYDNLLYILLI